MKKSLSLLVFACAALLAHAEVATLQLGARGKLTLYFPDGWTATSTDMAGQQTLTVSSTRDANASCSLQITAPEEDRLDTKARLKTRVEIEATPIAQGSVEGKAVAREFTLSAGYGFFCNFTDPALRGKPSQKGNYKVMSVGKIRLAPDVMVDVQIMADGFRDSAYNELLGAIEGMEYKR